MAQIKSAIDQYPDIDPSAFDKNITIHAFYNNDNSQLVYNPKKDKLMFLENDAVKAQADMNNIDNLVDGYGDYFNKVFSDINRDSIKYEQNLTTKTLQMAKHFQDYLPEIDFDFILDQEVNEEDDEEKTLIYNPSHEQISLRDNSTTIISRLLKHGHVVTNDYFFHPIKRKKPKPE